MATCDHRPMARAHPGILAVLATGAVLAAGCGSSGHSPASSSATSSGHGAASRNSTEARVDPAAVNVIVAWSDALRRGDVHRAASYFAFPSKMINGVGSGDEVQVITIRNLGQAEIANQTLPCGAKFISARRRGPYVNALFRLTGRPGPGGSNCGTGLGLTARTDFLIRHGRIVDWIRAPAEPGDQATPAASGPQV
jgi:hypothetical protein